MMILRIADAYCAARFVRAQSSSVAVVLVRAEHLKNKIDDAKQVDDTLSSMYIGGQR